PPRSVILSGPKNDNRTTINPQSPSPVMSPPAPSSAPNPPVVTPRRFTMPSQQNPSTAPASQTPSWVQQSPRTSRNEETRIQRQDQNDFTQPPHPRSMPE